MAKAAVSVAEHIANICEQAGLQIMEQVLDVVMDREEVTTERLLGLTADDIYPLYEAWVGPAVDDVEKSLLGLFD